MPTKKVTEAAQALAAKRHLSLSPERRREIAIKASKAAVKARKAKRAALSTGEALTA